MIPTAALGLRAMSDEKEQFTGRQKIETPPTRRELPTPTHIYVPSARDPGHKHAEARRRSRCAGWTSMYNFIWGNMDPKALTSMQSWPVKWSSKPLALRFRVTEAYFKSQSSWGCGSCTVSTSTVKTQDRWDGAGIYQGLMGFPQLLVSYQFSSAGPKWSASPCKSWWTGSDWLPWIKILSHLDRLFAILQMDRPIYKRTLFPTCKMRRLN